jgi:hypothetical protein
MKRFRRGPSLLITLIIVSLITVNGVHSSEAQSEGTNINGIIYSDTIWTQANGPYVLTGNVLVNSGVTLTIQAGTNVNLSNYVLKINGTLQARGDSNSPITLIGGQIIFTQYSTNWTESTGAGCIIQNSLITSALSLESSTLITSNCIFGGISIGNQLEVAIGQPTISKNTISGQGITLNWEAKANVYILDNVISGCSAGVKTSVPVLNSKAYNLIEGNLIVNNTHGIEIWVNGPNPNYKDVIRNNTITNNSVGISLNENAYPNPLLSTIEYNNIYGNTEYGINMDGSLGIPDDLNATYNWWGTTDPQEISQTIYDYYDNYNLGQLLFSPFLTAPNKEAPVGIIASSNQGGLITPNGIIGLNYGDNQALTITPDADYHITGVYVNGTMIGIPDSLFIQNVTSITIIEVTFASNSPEIWNVDSGTYSNGVHNWNPSTMKSDNGTIQINEPYGNWYMLYTALPSYCTAFNISLEVNAQSLRGFFVTTMANLPMVGSTNGAVCDIGPSAPNGGGAFTITRNTQTGWTWNRLGLDDIRNNTWYTIVLAVLSHPYTITGSIYDTKSGVLLGTYVASDMISPTFAQLSQGYIGFGASENGGNYTVNNVRIKASIAVPTQINLNVFSNLVNSGQIVNLGLNINQSLPSNTPLINGTGITIRVTYPDGSNSTLGPFTTNSNGETATTAAFGPLGNYTLKAFFSGQSVGDIYYLPSSSDEIILTVQQTSNKPTPNPTQTLNPTTSPTPKPTPSQAHISIFAQASSSTVGSAVYVKGFLTDNSDISIQGKTITLSYTIANSDSWVPIGSGTTDGNGQFNVQWVSTASGTFTLRAKWDGNNNYLPATATTTLSFLPYENQNVFLIESNSTVSALAFNSTSLELSFAVSGPSDAIGYVRATIAKSLTTNAQDIKVYIDGNQLNYTLTSSSDLWRLTFYYHHSTHQISINLTDNSRNNPSLDYNWELLLLIGAAVGGFGATILTVWWKYRKKKL